MKKKFIIVSLIATLGTGGFSSLTTTAKAAANNTYDLEAKIKVANSTISNLQIQMKTAQQESDNLTNAILDTQAKISEKTQQIAQTQQSIASLQTQISELTKRMEQRNSLLKERARSYQDSGGTIKYVEVLLGSQSFSDFIDRAGAVATMVEADREILKEHETDRETVEKSQAKMKSELASLETMTNDLKKMEASLAAKKQEKDHFVLGLKEKEKSIQAEVGRLQAEKSVLITKNVEIEKQNLLAVSSDKSQQAQQPKQTGSTPANTVSVQTSGNGLLIWPTIGGIITTYQGMRWGEFHKGIDIARPADYSILAANGGTVAYAGWINGYGNVVRINHPNGYLTQYSHLASINVSVGQTVNQGSKIAIMGSTGYSTGIHLDFEVYQNGKLLNPIDVLPRR
ncbi:murein hydrolase activator EnvC family protein [Neobacillus sp. SM06]|uniref:murein hydrolase activator EnvC family protein n=1 Tax=Neobacillus sp. SM06 TaxID=3422492 RepID=UPI003D286381